MFLTYKGATTELVSVSNGDYVKVYEVPKDYSEDGLYIAVWLHGDREPMPACAGKDARLLASVIISADNEGALTAHGSISEEVEIHA